MSESEIGGVLDGLPVLDAITDPDSGNVLLVLGEWRQRHQRIDNPNLTPTSQVADGSCSLFIQHCYWELNLPAEYADLKDVPLAEAADVPPSDHPKLFNHLVGDRIQHGQIVGRENTLNLNFDSGAALLVATRTTDRWIRRSKYTIHVIDDYWTVMTNEPIKHWSSRAL